MEPQSNTPSGFAPGTRAITLEALKSNRAIITAAMEDAGIRSMEIIYTVANGKSDINDIITWDARGMLHEPVAIFVGTEQLQDLETFCGAFAAEMVDHFHPAATENEDGAGGTLEIDLPSGIAILRYGAQSSFEQTRTEV